MPRRVVLVVMFMVSQGGGAGGASILDLHSGALSEKLNINAVYC